jgi:hypothetical protein
MELEPFFYDARVNSSENVTALLHEKSYQRVGFFPFSSLAGEIPFVVSVNTVKRHVYNLCNKLGVQSRTQAIARARNLNLL